MYIFCLMQQCHYSITLADDEDDDDDDDCTLKYIEIVPLDKVSDCSDVTDVKCREPDSVKVCDVFNISFTYLFKCISDKFLPHVGPGPPFPPCPFTSSSFPPFYFSLSFIGITYFLLLSIPSLSTRIVPLRFQAGGRRRRPNLGLVYFVCVICIP